MTEKPPDIEITSKELCALIAQVVKSSKLPITLRGIVGTGSYGVVVSVENSFHNTDSILKVFRISSEKLQPIKFPAINGQRTSWHSISHDDFKRGMKAQKSVYAEMLHQINIPQLQAAKIVRYDGSIYACAVMERIHSMTLNRVLNMPALKSSVKRTLVKRCGEMLKLLHNQQIVHADFHSWNILCDSKCKLFLIDFDKTARTSGPNHQLHDWGMFLDTINPDYWPNFAHGYYSDSEAEIPFDFDDIMTAAERKKRLHATSRHLFSLYVQDLRSNKLELL